MYKKRKMHGSFLQKILNLTIYLFSFAFMSNAQNVQFTSLPAHLQLFARDADDSALVRIAGTVNDAGYDSAHLKIYRNESGWKQLSQKLNYAGSEANFEFLPKIVAGLYEYRFEIFVDQNLLAMRDSIVCGDA